MSTDSYAISSASESQDAEMGETMVLEGPINYKSWVWENFTCVASKTKSKQDKHPPAFFYATITTVEIALFLNVIVE